MTNVDQIEHIASFRCLFNRCIHSFMHSFIHSLVRSFVHSFIHSSIHPSINHSFIPSFLHSFLHLLTHSYILTDSLHPFMPALLSLNQCIPSQVFQALLGCLWWAPSWAEPPNQTGGPQGELPWPCPYNTDWILGVLDAERSLQDFPECSPSAGFWFVHCLQRCTWYCTGKCNICRLRLSSHA